MAETTAVAENEKRELVAKDFTEGIVLKIKEKKALEANTHTYVIKLTFAYFVGYSPASGLYLVIAVCHPQTASLHSPVVLRNFNWVLPMIIVKLFNYISSFPMIIIKTA